MYHIEIGCVVVSGTAFSAVVVAALKRVHHQTSSTRCNACAVISIPATSEAAVMAIIVFSMRSASCSTGVGR